jgi:WD40 repeat protein
MATVAAAGEAGAVLFGVPGKSFLQWYPIGTPTNSDSIQSISITSKDVLLFGTYAGTWGVSLTGPPRMIQHQISNAPIWMTRWSPSGRLGAVGDEQGRVYCLDPERPGKPVEGIKHSGRINTMAWSADGTALYSLGGDGYLGISHPSSPTSNRKTKVDDEEGFGLAVSRTNGQVAASSGRYVVIFDREGSHELDRREFSGRINCLALSHDDHWLAAGGSDGTVHLFENHVHSRSRSVHVNGEVISIAIDDSNAVEIGTGNGFFVVYDAETGLQLLDSLRIQSSSIIQKIQPRPSGHGFLFCCNDGSIREVPIPDSSRLPQQNAATKSRALSGIVLRQDYPPQLMDRKEQLRTLSNR